MRKSHKFISLPIISLEEGLQIGSVGSLVVAPTRMEIAAIIIEQRGWFREQKIIPYSKVRSVGSDAITIDQSANVQRSVNLPEILKLINEKSTPIGTKVIIENGTIIGHVSEYYIDETTGEITTIEITGSFLNSLFKGKALLSAEYIRTMGTDSIIVKKDAESHLKIIESGLQETAQNLKEHTSNAWSLTKKQVKKLSKSIKTHHNKSKQADICPETDVQPQIATPEPPQQEINEQEETAVPACPREDINNSAIEAPFEGETDDMVTSQAIKTETITDETPVSPDDLPIEQPITPEQPNEEDKTN